MNNIPQAPPIQIGDTVLLKGCSDLDSPVLTVGKFTENDNEAICFYTAYKKIQTITIPVVALVKHEPCFE